MWLSYGCLLGVLVRRVKCGQIDTFDKAAFLEALVAQMRGHIRADLITLTLTAASLRITITVITREEDVAQEAVQELTRLSNSSTSELSLALGVPVTRTGSAPTIQVIYLSSPDIDDSITGSGSGRTIAIGALAALVLVATLGVGFKCWWRRSHNKPTQLLNVLSVQPGGRGGARPPEPTGQLQRGKYEMSEFI